VRFEVDHVRELPRLLCANCVCDIGQAEHAVSVSGDTVHVEDERTVSALRIRRR